MRGESDASSSTAFPAFSVSTASSSLAFGQSLPLKSKGREKIPEGTLCVVCGDLASGIHYSVASCNGCKTFFRRALVNKQQFTCQFSGDCIVGKSVRCVCRSCRLKKCFEMGMDPKAIQNDRDKIRYTKVLRKQKEAEMAERSKREAEEKERLAVMDAVKLEDLSPVSNLGDSCSPCTPQLPCNRLSDFDLSCDSDVMTDLTKTVETLMYIEERIVKVRTAYRFPEHTSATWNMYNNSLLDDDSWVKTHSVALPNSQEDCRCSLLGLRQWFVRDLTLMMEWVKCLPEAKDMLLNDKAALMRSFATCYPVMQLAYYSRDQTVYTTADNKMMIKPAAKPGSLTSDPAIPATTSGFYSQLLPASAFSPFTESLRPRKKREEQKKETPPPATPTPAGMQRPGVIVTPFSNSHASISSSVMSESDSDVDVSTIDEEVQPKNRKLSDKGNDSTTRPGSRLKCDASSPSMKTDLAEQSLSDNEADEVKRVDDDLPPSDPSPAPQVLSRLSYPDGTYIERDPSKEAMDELYMLMIDGFWRIFRMNEVDQKTFVLYKLMVFFNTDVTFMSEGGKKRVRLMRDKLVQHLYYFLASERGRKGHLVYANLLMMNNTIARVAQVQRKLFTMDHFFERSNDLLDQLVISGF